MHQFDRHKARHRERMALLQEKLPGLSVRESSPDGAVELSVNAEGVMTALSLDDHLQGSSPRDIASLVLRTYISAQRKAARQVAELISPLVGESGYLQERLRWRESLQPDVTDWVEPNRPSGDDEGYDEEADTSPMYRA